MNPGVRSRISFQKTGGRSVRITHLKCEPPLDIIFSAALSGSITTQIAHLTLIKCEPQLDIIFSAALSGSITTQIAHLLYPNTTKLSQLLQLRYYTK
jgi:hypothetical protein